MRDRAEELVNLVMQGYDVHVAYNEVFSRLDELSSNLMDSYHSLLDRYGWTSKSGPYKNMYVHTRYPNQIIKVAEKIWKHLDLDRERVVEAGIEPKELLQHLEQWRWSYDQGV